MEVGTARVSSSLAPRAHRRSTETSDSTSSSLREVLIRLELPGEAVAAGEKVCTLGPGLTSAWEVVAAGRGKWSNVFALP